jgi:luciferase family oxidoreductase group 1
MELTQTTELALSVLDLSPVSSGTTATEALQNTLALARTAEKLGYGRYWLAEHHNMPGIAGSSPEILIGQVAAATSYIRVGSGGVLPNHAPLKVAEDFLTLEALFPGRIDLGIGRAAGSDPRTALALRRSQSKGEELPEQLEDLFAFSGGGFPDNHPFRSVAAAPMGVPLPPVWLLGSSDYSARIAGQMGLGFGFAYHINPYGAETAMQIYREHWAPSVHMAAPRALVTVSVVCAPTEAEADELASSLDLAWLRLSVGHPSLFPSVEEAQAYPYTQREQYQVRETRARLIVGAPQSVHRRLNALAAETGVEEVMVTTMVHSHEARLRSYKLLAEAFDLPPRL